MAGETPVPVTYYPDEFGEFFLHIPDEITANTDRCLFYAEREIVIDAMIIDCGVEDAACTAQLFHGDWPADNDTALTGVTGFQARTATSATIEEENVVPAGKYINVDINVTTGITDAIVLVRYRTRRK